MLSYTDEQILKSLKHRENHVVAYIAKKYLPMVKHMLVEFKGDENEAEDIFQEALIIIIKKIDSREFKLTAKFSTYLYAVCKNLFDYRKKRKAAADKYLIAELETVAEEDFSEDYDKKYQYKIYKYYFSKLGEGCQDILNMHWLDMSMKEIAEKLGSSEGYIRKRKHACKKKLIELIMTNPDNINSD
ncbi:MAG: sigma-70 family RNA polymerase sigma factor [Bacteroidales bacterium]|nr:sigma-70 family RNA polymerase sigma factor [Bacteroidales bacterium]